MHVYMYIQYVICVLRSRSFFMRKLLRLEHYSTSTAAVVVCLLRPAVRDAIYY